jgi:hypothetical protein
VTASQVTAQVTAAATTGVTGPSQAPPWSSINPSLAAIAPPFKTAAAVAEAAPAAEIVENGSETETAATIEAHLLSKKEGASSGSGGGGVAGGGGGGHANAPGVDIYANINAVYAVPNFQGGTKQAMPPPPLPTPLPGGQLPGTFRFGNGKCFKFTSILCIHSSVTTSTLA